MTAAGEGGVRIAPPQVPPAIGTWVSYTVGDDGHARDLWAATSEADAMDEAFERGPGTSWGQVVAGDPAAVAWAGDAD